MLKEIFDEAFERFLQEERALIVNNSSERALCCRLAMKLEDIIHKRKIEGYYADAEYNRNHGRVKTIIGAGAKELVINTDIIVHSRGENLLQDNLIVIEMKKSTQPLQEKNDDRDRLVVMTKDSYDDVWSADGITKPEHVCGYELGVFIEINVAARRVRTEFFEKGAFRNAMERSF